MIPEHTQRAAAGPWVMVKLKMLAGEGDQEPVKTSISPADQCLGHSMAPFPVPLCPQPTSSTPALPLPYRMKSGLPWLTLPATECMSFGHSVSLPGLGWVLVPTSCVF